MAKFDKVKTAIDGLPESRKEIALNLLGKIKFMDLEIMKLQKILKKKGWTEEYQNGENQKGLKKSSEADVYNTLIKNYLSAVKQLTEMLPVSEESGESLADELASLIS